MAGCERIEIVLTNPQVLYFPGQTIQGQLQIDATSDIRTRAITVQCYGEGHVQWDEYTGNEQASYCTVKASEVYMDARLTVFQQDGKTRAVLSEGKHVFPFEFVLPPSVPGSFEGKKDCYVRYWLTGIIEGTHTNEEQASGDTECKTRFNVGSVVDLNTTLGAKRVTYMTHKGRKHKKEQECARLQRGAIQPGGSDVFCGERLLIPPLPPSHLPGCKLIDIEYVVKMTVSLVDSLSNLSLAADVIIGTIPLHSALQDRPPGKQMDACLGQTGPPEAQAGTPGNFDIPPPSYQECMIGRTGEADNIDPDAPPTFYAYYDWINPPHSSTTCISTDEEKPHTEKHGSDKPCSSA